MTYELCAILMAAGCDTVRLQSYGMKYTPSRYANVGLGFWDPGQVGIIGSKLNFYDIAKQHPARKPGHIDLWTFNRRMRTRGGVSYRSFPCFGRLGGGAGGLRLKVPQCYKLQPDGTSKFIPACTIKIYSTFVHALKGTFLILLCCPCLLKRRLIASGKNQITGNPGQLGTMQNNISTLLERAERAKSFPEEIIPQTRVEIVKARAVLMQDAMELAVVSGYLELDGLLLGPRLIHSSISVEEWCANVTELWNKAELYQIFAGNTSAKPTERQKRAYGDLLTTFGLDVNFVTCTPTSETRPWWEGHPAPEPTESEQVGQYFDTFDGLKKFYSDNRDALKCPNCGDLFHSSSNQNENARKRQFRIRCRNKTCKTAFGKKLAKPFFLEFLGMEENKDRIPSAADMAMVLETPQPAPAAQNASAQPIAIWSPT